MEKNNFLLKLSSINTRFNERVVLERLDLSIEKGEFVSILGKSGSGKSVLLKTILGLNPICSGKILKNTESEHIGIAFQHSPLFPWLNLYENIFICMDGLPFSIEGKKDWIEKHFEIAGLTGFENHLPSQVSGGMQQKVNLIRSICRSPDLVLMDEPFAHLDFFQRRELQQFLIKLCELTGKTILFVTHDIDEALFLSSRVLILSAKEKRIVLEVKNDFLAPRIHEEMKNDTKYRERFQTIMKAVELQ